MIRPAERSDLPAIRVLAWQMFQETSAWHSEPPDMSGFEDLLMRDPSFFIYVAEDAEHILTGFLICQLAGQPYIRSRGCQSVLFYVQPGYRHHIPARLLKAAEQRAMEEGCDYFLVSTAGGGNLDSHYHLMQGTGFKLVGLVAMKEIQHELAQQSVQEEAERSADPAERTHGQLGSADQGTDGYPEALSDGARLPQFARSGRSGPADF
jgi:hypothetical protein